jgi:hypothetical protein
VGAVLIARLASMPMQLTRTTVHVGPLLRNDGLNQGHWDQDQHKDDDRDPPEHRALATKGRDIV